MIIGILHSPHCNKYKACNGEIQYYCSLVSVDEIKNVHHHQLLQRITDHELCRRLSVNGGRQYTAGAARWMEIFDRQGEYDLLLPGESWLPEDSGDIDYHIKDGEIYL